MAKHTNKTTAQTRSNEAAKPLNDSNLRDQIEKRAHEIWLSSGGSHGTDIDHWLQAESEVLAEHQKRTKADPLSLDGHIR